MLELREFTTADAHQLIEWIDGPEELFMWGGPSFTWPLDVEQLAAYKAKASAVGLPWSAWEVPPGTLVGHLALTITPVYRVGRLGHLLVAPGARGRGIATAIMEESLRVSFDELGLHRVEGGVYPQNTTALHIYEGVGFVREGLRRDFGCWEGRRLSLIEIGILAHEWSARSTQASPR